MKAVSTQMAKLSVSEEEFDPTQYFNNRLTQINNFPSLNMPLYPHKFEITHQIKEIITKYADIQDGTHLQDVTVRVAGRIIRVASSGSKLKFYDLRGNFSKIQIIAQLNNHKSSVEFAHIHDSVRRGDIVGVVGFPGKSKKGEMSIFCEEMVLLSPCLHMLPKYKGLKDLDTRYRQRFVDLISNEEVVQTFITRTQIIQFVRNFLLKHNFLEVETPILNQIAGGASARPFTTYHNSLSTNLYLRIAPELYLKELIVGGIEKVFEIGKNFRNEGIDMTHNPEFTSCEFYWAYADYNDLMKFTENMLSSLVYSIKGSYKVEYHPNGPDEESIILDFEPPYDRLPLLSEIEKRSGVVFGEPLNSEENREMMINLLKRENVELPNPPTLAKCIDQLCGHFVESTIVYKPAFIIDHPQLMSPLAKWHRSKPNMTERFELFVHKKELINAYTELNDPVFQRNCFYEQAKAKAQGDDEVPEVDENFLTALEYGLPPTAGWGFGLDRMTMFLTNHNNIKEVILFPAMRPKTAETNTPPNENQNSKEK